MIALLMYGLLTLTDAQLYDATGCQTIGGAVFDTKDSTCLLKSGEWIDTNAIHDIIDQPEYSELQFCEDTTMR